MKHGTWAHIVERCFKDLKDDGSKAVRLLGELRSRYTEWETEWLEQLEVSMLKGWKVYRRINKVFLSGSGDTFRFAAMERTPAGWVAFGLSPTGAAD